MQIYSLREEWAAARGLVWLAGSAALAVALLAAHPAQAFDPEKVFEGNVSSKRVFQFYFDARKKGQEAEAVSVLKYAADQGNPGAQWKLGRMYQTGDLVTEDDSKAMEFFARVASDFGDGNPNGPEAPFVADAFNTLGAYYRSGIPGAMEADAGMARRVFAYSASYFGDSDAQHTLAMMFLLGQGGPQDARQAVRWFKLAARKGHVEAQAEFGHMLYEGIGVDRRPLEGLMWLSIARLSSPGDPAIQARHEQAFSTADEALRRDAMLAAEAWLYERTGGAQAQADAPAQLDAPAQ